MGGGHFVILQTAMSESVLLAVARAHGAAFADGSAKSQWEHFEYAVKLAMARWTALRMAIEGEWGGGDMRQKYELLLDEVLNVFKYNKSVFADDMAEDLANYVESQFGLICEDGSAEELAELLTVLADECKKGDYTRVQNLREQVEALFPIDLKAAKVRGEGGEDASMEAIAEGAMEDEEEAPPLVDADGFTTVRRSGRRKTAPKFYDPAAEFPGAQ